MVSINNSQEVFVMFDFEKLNVYQKAVDFADSVYETTKSFPKSEIYGITGQFRRALCLTEYRGGFRPHP